MDELERRLRKVHESARSGAASATKDRQRARDAIERVLEQWGRVVVAGRTLSDEAAWAFRCAANAARRRQPGSSPKPIASASMHAADGFRPVDGWLDASHRAVAKALLNRKKGRLRGRQLEVVRKLLEPRMTVHRAARELGMDRSSVRRSFASALRRLTAPVKARRVTGSRKQA